MGRPRSPKEEDTAAWGSREGGKRETQRESNAAISEGKKESVCREKGLPREKIISLE